MRLAVLSDIHANLAALEAVLADLDTLPVVDELWVCGDIVGYGPQPNEVIEQLRRRAALYRRAAGEGEHPLPLRRPQGPAPPGGRGNS